MAGFLQLTLHSKSTGEASSAVSIMMRRLPVKLANFAMSPV